MFITAGLETQTEDASPAPVVERRNETAGRNLRLKTRIQIYNMPIYKSKAYKSQATSVL
jgi:hypothetical protein